VDMTVAMAAIVFQITEIAMVVKEIAMVVKETAMEVKMEDMEIAKEAEVGMEMPADIEETEIEGQKLLPLINFLGMSIQLIVS